MRGITAVWQELPVTKKATLGAALIGTIIIMTMIGRMAAQPEMSLLYAGLDPASAGEVIANLESRNVLFEVRGDAIYVPAASRDRVRLQLARDGAPRQGSAGYELLDGLNGFSTTSELFDATYWRAKEGELARTMLASNNMQSVRVHIAAPQDGAFARTSQAPTASVTLTARAPASQQQALSFRYLVALAVPGLAPENVAVIDSERGLILAPGGDNPAAAALSDKADRERRLASDLTRLVEARVGRGNAQVNVSLDLDYEREAIRERIIDPDTRTVIGRETNETSEQSSGSRGGAVTVASNLPEGDAGAPTNQNSRRQTETRENLRYDMSEINREKEKLPGAVKRMGVAVLINTLVDENGDGRTQEELDALRALIVSASGLDEARGDSLTLEALTFSQAPELGTIAEPSFVSNFMERHLMSVIKISVLAITALILGLFVVKPLLNKAPPPALPQTSAQAALQAPTAAELSGEAPGGAAGGAMAQAAPIPPGEKLKSIATEKTDETAALLKSWLEQPEDAT